MAQAVNGADIHVDVTAIEKQLAELWRAEKHDHDDAVTRAALWNVVAHTWTPDQHAHATEILSRASASVPQRTIIIQADMAGSGAISSWISANCHLLGGGRQVCSEEVSIVASGGRVHHVPPLVSALLLPDMPVAVWWLGDLPNEHRGYAETLLDPADRLIVDSSQFDSVLDLELVSRIAERTTTAPADLNWARLEEWRAATAALFDPPPMRARLPSIRGVRVIGGGDGSFGARALALLYVAWLSAQSGIDIGFDVVQEPGASAISAIDIHFEGASMRLVRRDGGAVVAHCDGTETRLESVARPLARETEDLIVRLLKRPEADRVYLRTLEVARRLAE